ncbi:hypothetical protein SY88_08640 [Clostridiales bacterium PH28_bin88]|nr:hypothetical protein SY88_08640 [Clostridiales bacterium PH28_bin88]
MPGRVNKSGSPIGRVKCVVNSCTFWENGDRCRAESIEIQPPNARDTEMTDCATFAPKGGGL